MERDDSHTLVLGHDYKKIESRMINDDERGITATPGDAQKPTSSR